VREKDVARGDDGPGADEFLGLGRRPACWCRFCETAGCINPIGGHHDPRTQRSAVNEATATPAAGGPTREPPRTAVGNDTLRTRNSGRDLGTTAGVARNRGLASDLTCV